MKKVGIVTYHRSPSYGACLQAYASQNFFQELNCDAEIIDYLNSYEQRIKKVFFSADGTFKSMMKNAVKSIVFRRNILLKKAYSDFYKNYNITKTTYRSPTEMNDLEYDVLVVGSDQVWNPNISNGIDPVFLLEFGKARKRISLSSSFGSYCLHYTEKEKIKKAISLFSDVSVRENFAREQLNKLGISNIKVLNDPPLLVNPSVWKKLAKSVPDNKFIFTYFVSGSFCDFESDVMKISKQYNLPVYNLQSSGYKWHGVDKTLVGVTPEHFLGYIQNAELVITDSFHGTVFSNLFHKQYIIINNKSNPVRINELLNKLSLNERIYHNSSDFNAITDLQFANVDKVLAEGRKEAIEWVKGILEYEN